MEEPIVKKPNWKTFRFPVNITPPGRSVRLFAGTGLFTFGFLQRRPFMLFFGVTELISAATAYSPVYDLYHIYQKYQGNVASLKNKNQDAVAIHAAAESEEVTPVAKEEEKATSVAPVAPTAPVAPAAPVAPVAAADVKSEEKK